MLEDADDGEQWPPSWTRAALELAVLAVVRREGPVHGYDVGRHLLGSGLGRIKGGTLYPVLGRLEDQGLLSSRWVAGDGGPGRKLVETTAAGLAELARRRAGWLAWTGRVTTLLTTADEDEGATDDDHATTHHR